MLLFRIYYASIATDCKHVNKLFGAIVETFGVRTVGSATFVAFNGSAAEWKEGSFSKLPSSWRFRWVCNGLLLGQDVAADVLSREMP